MSFEGYPFSGLKVFQITEGHESDAWDSIRGYSSNLGSWGVSLLRSGLDRHVKSVVVEPRYVCKDYRSLFSHFYSKKFVERSSFCNRLLFFSQPGVTIERAIFDAPSLADSFIGYSVIQPIQERCIGRTVVDPFKLGKNMESFFCLTAPSQIHLNGSEYTTNGYPYMSQSCEPTVCAHSALWGVCRYLCDAHRGYKELYPYDLIRMTGSQLGRRVPYRGMTYTDYSEILTAFGCHPVILKMRTQKKAPGGEPQVDWTLDKEQFHDLYAYIESGFPVLASFGGHVTAIIGHTPSKVFVGNHTPEYGAFYNSYCFLKQYVAVDDNRFPYVLLGYQGDNENYGQMFTPPSPSIDGIAAAVVPLPEKAFLPPKLARRLAYKFLDHTRIQQLINGVKERLKPQDPRQVARLFLTSATSFKARKKELSIDIEGGCIDPLLGAPIGIDLPHFIWVMEISFISEYLEGNAIGEVVLDASVSRSECQYIYMRIGNTILRGTGDLGCDPLKTLAGGRMKFPQYTHNLGER